MGLFKKEYNRDELLADARHWCRKLVTDNFYRYAHEQGAYDVVYGEFLYSSRYTLGANLDPNITFGLIFSATYNIYFQEGGTFDEFVRLLNNYTGNLSSKVDHMKFVLGRVADKTRESIDTHFKAGGSKPSKLQQQLYGSQHFEYKIGTITVNIYASSSDTLPRIKKTFQIS